MTIVIENNTGVKVNMCDFYVRGLYPEKMGYPGGYKAVIVDGERKDLPSSFHTYKSAMNDMNPQEIHLSAEGVAPLALSHGEFRGKNGCDMLLEITNNPEGQRILVHRFVPGDRDGNGWKIFQKYRDMIRGMLRRPTDGAQGVPL